MSFLAEDIDNSLMYGIKKYFISPCNTCDMFPSGKQLNNSDFFDQYRRFFDFFT